MTALRPLYLDRGAAAVRLEGPALIVDQPEAAEGRFPIRLLVKAAWFKRYRENELPEHFDRIASDVGTGTTDPPALDD